MDIGKKKRKRKRKKYSTKFKIEIIKRLVDGNEKLSSLAKEYGLHSSYISYWKKVYDEQGEKGLMKKKRGKKKIDDSLLRRHNLQILVNDKEYTQLMDLYEKEGGDQSISMYFKSILLNHIDYVRYLSKEK